MTSLEILAELKISFNNLQDIIDNADYGQISNEERENLIKIIQELYYMYISIYFGILKENKKQLKYDKDTYISNDINYDFMYEDTYFSYDETKKGQKWYEDIKFLTKLNY